MSPRYLAGSTALCNMSCSVGGGERRGEDDEKKGERGVKWERYASYRMMGTIKRWEREEKLE